MPWDLERLPGRKIHFFLYIIIAVMCIISSVVWQATTYCVWKSLVILVFEMHAAPAFAIIFLCIFALYLFEKPPTLSLCIVFDLIGFLIHLVVASLQFLAFLIRYENHHYEQNGTRIDQKKNQSACDFNYSCFLNFLIALLIILDMVLYIYTDGSYEEASHRPHNIGKTFF